jgi:protein-S-isoprenylcysteine O-methyltransferase Ste14
MKSIFILFALLHFVFAVSHSHLNTSVTHNAVMNLPCCNSYGGIICGYLWKTCCLGRCNNWLIAQTCGGVSLDLKP